MRRKATGPELGGYDHRQWFFFSSAVRERKESSRFDRVDSPLDIPPKSVQTKFGSRLCVYTTNSLGNGDDRASFFFFCKCHWLKWRPSRLCLLLGVETGLRYIFLPAAESYHKIPSYIGTADITWA